MKSLALCLLILCFSTRLPADMGGPIDATPALSPDGNILARITRDRRLYDEKRPWKHPVTVFKYDESKDSYLPRARFEVEGSMPQLMYVSDAGDVVLVYFSGSHALELYTEGGKAKKSWKLTDFLTEAEIEGSAETTSTLQWFWDGSFFNNRLFNFVGPAQGIRFGGSATVLKESDPKVAFEFMLDVSKKTLHRVTYDDTGDAENE